MAHQLHITVKDNELDHRYLYVSDFSDYDPLVAINNRTLRVQLPGFDTAIDLLFTLKGTSTYSNKTFGIATSSGNPGDLADGLYTFTLSVAPNLSVHTVLYHYRTTLLEAQLYSAIALLLQKSVLNTSIDGEQLIEKHSELLLRAQMIIAGIKRPMQTSADVVALNRHYREAERIISSILNKVC